MLKDQLKADGIQYEEVDRASVEHFPYETVPQLWLDGSHIGGYMEYQSTFHNENTDSGECEACAG